MTASAAEGGGEVESLPAVLAFAAADAATRARAGTQRGSTATATISAGGPPTEGAKAVASAAAAGGGRIGYDHSTVTGKASGGGSAPPTASSAAEGRGGGDAHLADLCPSAGASMTRVGAETPLLRALGPPVGAVPQTEGGPHLVSGWRRPVRSPTLVRRGLHGAIVRLCRTRRACAPPAPAAVRLSAVADGGDGVSSEYRSVLACALQLCSSCPLLRELVLRRILRKWPSGHSDNEIALLEFLATVLAATTHRADLVVTDLRSALLGRVLLCLRSAHVKVARTALVLCDPRRALVAMLVEGDAAALRRLLEALQVSAIKSPGSTYSYIHRFSLRVDNCPESLVTSRASRRCRHIRRLPPPVRSHVGCAGSCSSARVAQCCWGSGGG